MLINRGNKVEDACILIGISDRRNWLGKLAWHVTLWLMLCC